MVDRPLTNWNSGICDCFEDASTCCYGFWCCPCLACTVSNKFGENRCLPLCDIFSPGIFAAVGIPLIAPPAVLSLRAAMRNRYNIKGSLCKDIAVACFCSYCAWCQLHRELKERRKAPVIINVHSNPVNVAPHHHVNVAPYPVNAAPYPVNVAPQYINGQPVVVMR